MACPKREDSCLRYLLGSLERSALLPLKQQIIREQLQRPARKPTKKETQ
jgi:hypothetical protein